MDETIIYFLRDFTALLYERARESKERCKSVREQPDNTASADFECGRALAYYEVLSTKPKFSAFLAI